MNNYNNNNFKKNPEVDQGSVPNVLNPLSNIFKSIQGFYYQLLEWFKELPQWAKIISLIIIPLFIIKILEAIISLVSLLITIAVFGGAIYIGYKFLFLPNYSETGKDEGERQK
ncbi:MAG: hypothetical protein F6K25_12835 [Okeania sp. SIO2G4]|uniref:hypothetical protein n=1 Tax=unclassified Okeania TaxID=2634635 RepID=UPI0013B7A6E1|nr:MULTISPECIES: hypothetical protein [unclassified Okeania]NEP72845.1 hypothetical protein [Okeania sp. SIO2G5]NEP93632.1 hypothetical protein [Okeania sp. SIO2F5]NEQ91536.1 hypothetical protein [Okeania sp. SIO2G4]